MVTRSHQKVIHRDHVKPTKDVLHEKLRTAAIRETNNIDVNITAEEAARLEEAFGDQEFRRLMAEYVQEISDPKYREEQEAYISELESTQNTPKDKLIVRPDPFFVMKIKFRRLDNSFVQEKKENVHKNSVVRSTKKETNKNDMKEKIFINIVTSRLIDTPTSKVVTAQSGDKTKTQWILPYSLGPLRMELDKSKSLTPTYDCCFNPEVIARTDRIPGFKDLLSTTAKESVIKQYSKMHTNIEFDKRHHIINGTSYKNGKPPTMLISDPLLKNKRSNDCKKNGPTASMKSFGTCISAPKLSERSQTFTKEFKESFKKNMEIKKATKKTGTMEKDKVNQNAMSDICENLPCEDILTPHYTLSERNIFDISENTMVNTNIARTRPQYLTYRISLPKIKKLSDIDLDISDERLMIKSVNLSFSCHYLLDLKFPYPTNKSGGGIKAKWNKCTKVLLVVIPVRQREEPEKDNQIAPKQEIEETSFLVTDADKLSGYEMWTNGKKPIADNHTRWVRKREEYDKDTNRLTTPCYDSIPNRIKPPQFSKCSNSDRCINKNPSEMVSLIPKNMAADRRNISSTSYNQVNGKDDSVQKQKTQTQQLLVATNKTITHNMKPSVVEDILNCKSRTSFSIGETQDTSNSVCDGRNEAREPIPKGGRQRDTHVKEDKINSEQIIFDLD